MQFANAQPWVFFFVAPAHARLTNLALPLFIGVPLPAHVVPSAAAPRLALHDDRHGLAAALAPGRPLRRVTFRIGCTLRRSINRIAVQCARRRTKEGRANFSHPMMCVREGD